MAERYEDRRYISDDDVAATPRPASGGKEGDPLAELAKLIGQTDPFANFGRANPTHPLRRDAPQRGPSDSEQADRHDTDAYFDREIFDEAPSPPAWVQHRNEALADTGPADPDDIANRPHPLHRFPPHGENADSDAQYADGQYQDAHYGADAPSQYPAYQDDPYAYQDDYADQPDAARQKSRRGLMTVAAVLGLAVIGTGGAFAYRTYVASPRSSGEVPVIKADNAPIKVVPPTSADAANKLIQDRIGSATGETIVPREEQPVDVRDPTKAGARPNPSFASRAPSAGSVPVAPSTGPTGTAGEEPRRVRTFTVKGDQSDANPAAKSAPKPPVAAAPAPARPAAPASTANQQANLAAPSAPLSLSPRANPPAPAQTSGGYVVQVSSQRSEADAQASYRALQAKFPSVLGSRSSIIKRADLGEKGTYYRAVLGPFSSPEDAASLCGSLKSAGGQCVVQRN